MKIQVEEHCFLGLFLCLLTSSSPFVAAVVCELKEHEMTFLKYLGFKFSSHLLRNWGWPVMTPCPVVPGNIISKGIRLRRKQTLEPPVAHLPNYLLDSGSLSWAKDLFSKITHCQTILWYSKMAEILINPRWIGRKTTLNQLFSCSLKFNKQYFLKLMEVSKWQFQHEINSRGIYDWSTPKVLYKTFKTLQDFHLRVFSPPQ